MSVVDYSEHCINAAIALKELEAAARNNDDDASSDAAVRLLFLALLLHARFCVSP